MELEIKLKRLRHNETSTVGRLYTDDGVINLVTLEDTRREVKIPGKTRIPSGRYEIRYRLEGSMHNRYKISLPKHKGMLWLQDVPEFEWVYIHIGNDHSDTRGCILVGKEILTDDFIGESTIAYIYLYNYISDAFERGDRVFINIMDED